jgi:actin related protein 2/3 complex subunit 3
MPAYHSIFLDEPNQQLIGNFAILPLRTKTRGPAQQLSALPSDISELDVDPSSESYDPLDEVLSLFRANTFFRNFEIKGPADRVLIYGILFVSEALSKIKPGMSRREAEKSVFNVSLDTNFAIPGDAGFPLNQAYEAPRDRNEAEVLRQYIMQMRQELAARLLNRVYADQSGQPSKVSACNGRHARFAVEVLILIAVVAELPEAEVHGQAAVSRKYGMYRGIQRRNDRASTTCGIYRAHEARDEVRLGKMQEEAAKKAHRSSSEATGNHNTDLMVTREYSITGKPTR